MKKFKVGDKVCRRDNPNLIMNVFLILGKESARGKFAVDMKLSGFKDGDVMCEWYDSSEERKTEYFRSEMLVLKD